MERQRLGFFTYRGRRFYLIDVEGLDPAQVTALVDPAARDIRAEPLASLYTITHVKGVQLEHKMIERLRWLADGNKPHVKAAAVTGLSSIQRFVFNMVRILTGREFHLFETIEEAKEALSKLP